MDVTCITATCPGREKFLERCMEYVDRFTLRPKHHIIADRGSLRDNLLFAAPLVKTEYVAFIEDDDWYHPDYLGDMLDRLDYSGRLLIGYDPTLYYHLRHSGYKVLPHLGRASLYTTIGVTSFVQMALDEVLKTRNPIDMSLWALARGSGVTTVGRLAIGMKHGFTRAEGVGHEQPNSFWTRDTDGEQLRKWIGDTDFEKYREIVNHYREIEQ